MNNNNNLNKTVKKYFILAAAAIATLAACNKVEPESAKTSHAINFSAVAGKTTKAIITSTYYGTDAPVFGVFTYALSQGKTWASNHADGQAYMNNVQVKYNEASDIWEPWNGSSFETYYWPLSGSLTFVGYSPYKASGVAYDVTTQKLTFTNFTVAASAAAQEDLMWATTNANLTDNQSNYLSGSTDVASSVKGVNIVFHHALSQVAFTVSKAATLTDYTVTVKGISFNAFKQGTLEVTNDSPSWGEATVNETFTAGASDLVTTTSAAAYGTANLAVPQDLDAQQFSITYALSKGGVDLGSKTVNVNLRNGAITAWNNNTKYVYNITIDLNKIYFNPTIEDWTSPATEQGVSVN